MRSSFATLYRYQSFLPLSLKAPVRAHTLRPFTFVRMASTLPNSSIFKTLAQHDRKTPAIIHSQSGRSFTYGSLIHDIAAAKDDLWARVGNRSLQGERVAFLAENGYDYIGESGLFECQPID